MSGLTIVELLGILAPVFLLVYTFQRNAKYPLPPGPSGSWISGNAKQLPASKAWNTYQHWGQTYGPVVYFRILTRRYIVLNSAKAVVDLLDKRADIYSDKPKLWMYQELCNRKHNVLSISSSNPRHKIYRRVLNTHLNRRALPKYYDVMRSESIGMLARLHERPEEFVAHLRRFVGSVIMKVAYGYQVRSDDDFFIRGAEAAFEAAGKAMEPGRWLIDYFPLLRFIPFWFPGAGFQLQANAMRAELDKLTWAPHNWVKEQMAKGDYIDSVTSRMLLPEDGSKPTAEEEDIGMHIVSGLYAGASDTTVSALSTFFLVMALNPSVQRRAQAEIDTNVGRDRLPDFEDQEVLPYVLALIKEMFRWGPVSPLGSSHAVITDDIYEGYRIPKGTTIIPNVWAIMHDETIYPDPFTFNPERFLKNGDDENEVQRDPYDFEFGFGRRICPGMAFAHDQIFLTITRILSTFNITKAKDKTTAEEIEPVVDYADGVTSHPKPFKCSIALRDDALPFLA